MTVKVNHNYGEIALQLILHLAKPVVTGLFQERVMVSKRITIALF
jgi:hypothetical protein